MNLEGILSISGKAGLYKLISQTKNTLIVESLIDGKKMPLYASHQVSSLQDIGIYTYNDTMPLSEVFEKIFEKENGQQALSHKESKENHFKWLRDVMPEFDEDRVYHSDIKKLIQWYNLLQSKGLIEVSKEETKK
ncbi:MAG: DUF5606 domain-containing protein [Flavobacteriales bacterium]